MNWRLKTREQVEAELSLYNAAIDENGGDYGRAAVALGIANRKALASRLCRLRAQAERGEFGTSPVMPTFAITSVTHQTGPKGEHEREWLTQRKQAGEVFERPEGQVLDKLSTLTDSNGRIILKWEKSKRATLDPAKFRAEVEEHFATFKPAAKPVKAPRLAYEDQLTLYPWSDPHFGLMVWGSEASENWDLKISVDTIRDTFAQVVARTPPTKHAILLVGGDTLHADNNLNRTPQSGHALQVDGRHQKVILTACETIVNNIHLALRNHESVEVIVIPGNHDETSAYPIAMFVYAWFRNEPRVNVDLSPGLFRFREFGKVMLGTTHGHAAKAKDMPGIMAAREPEAWGRTRHRYVHTFHVHHSSKLLSEGGGCIAETHQIIAPQDAWHYGAGFLSGRSMQSICYDRERGEVARARVAVG